VALVVGVAASERERGVPDPTPVGDAVVVSDRETHSEALGLIEGLAVGDRAPEVEALGGGVNDGRALLETENV
jgi:hypothetical protein